MVELVCTSEPSRHTHRLKSFYKESDKSKRMVDYNI